MEGNPERVNVLVVEERGVVERGGRVAVNEEEKRKAEREALRREEALGFAEFQQTRGKRDDDRLTGCIETAGSSAGPASLMRGSYFPTKTCNYAIGGDEKR